MLVEPGRSPYDLNFRLFGFPVRVHPFFWLGAGLLGASLLQSEYPACWFVWIVIVFVSIIVHEMGHALAFRVFGCTILHRALRLWRPCGAGIGNPWPRSLGYSSLSPDHSLDFFLQGSYLDRFFSETGAQGLWTICFYFFTAIFVVNLYWGILNLFPVFPLDGGQVSRELCEAFWGGRGQRISLQISIGVAIAVAAYSLLCVMEERTQNHQLLSHLPRWFPRGDAYLGILFGLLAYQSYQLLQHLGRGVYYEAPDDRLPWEK